MAVNSAATAAAAAVAKSVEMGARGFANADSLFSSSSRVSAGPRSQRNAMSSIRCSAVEAATPIAKEPAAPAKEEEENDGRVYNFAAGPATLPVNVLKQVQQDLVNWQGCGMSIMEMSHRSKEFLSVIQKAEADLRKLLNIPENYEVLFLQGGASTVFSMVPLNLCPSGGDVGDYIVSGSWGDKAFKEGAKYCSPNLAWSGKAGKYTRLPGEGDEVKLTPGAKFVHICANETIHGVEYKDDHYPDVGEGTVLVADMSSNFCSKPVDVTKFGMIYAGAQKNVGPAGVTIVIVRKDLIGSAQAITPVMSNLKTHADNQSLYNTPPCFAIYVCGLVFADLLEQGGLEAIARKNAEKAQVLYDAIDSSNGYFKCPVEKSVRSFMNVPFTMETPELEAEFIKEATSKKMVQLKGHRSVGGARASIYNAMPKAGVDKLVKLMKEFQARH